MIDPNIGEQLELLPGVIEEAEKEIAREKERKAQEARQRSRERARERREHIRREKEVREQLRAAVVFINKVQLMPIVTDKGMVKHEPASRIYSN